MLVFRNGFLNSRLFISFKFFEPVFGFGMEGERLSSYEIIVLKPTFNEHETNEGNSVGSVCIRLGPVSYFFLCKYA